MPSLFCVLSLTGTKLSIAPINIEAIVDELPNKAKFLRQAVIHRLLEVGKLTPEQAASLLHPSQHP